MLSCNNTIKYICNKYVKLKEQNKVDTKLI